jgi:hypothetical protein
MLSAYHYAVQTMSSVLTILRGVNGYYIYSILVVTHLERPYEILSFSSAFSLRDVHRISPVSPIAQTNEQ